MKRNGLRRAGSVFLMTLLLGAGTAAAEETMLVRGEKADDAKETVSTREICFEYETAEDHVILTKYTGTESSVTVPDEIEGVPVTVIGEGTFENCDSMKEVEIGSGILEIEAKAFAGCSALTEIHIPYNVERIANDSFENTGLTVVSGRKDSLAPVLADYLEVNYREAEDVFGGMQEEAEKTSAEPDTLEEESEMLTEISGENAIIPEKADAEEADAEKADAEEAETAEFIFPDSDTVSLTEEQISGLPIQLLVYGKYEIFARCGMLFQSPELAGYFESRNWYFGFISEESFPENMLSDTARGNIQLLDQQIEAGGSVYQLDQPGYSYDIVYEYLSGNHAEVSGVTEAAEMETEGKKDADQAELSADDSTQVTEEETEMTESEEKEAAKTVETETMKIEETKSEEDAESEMENAGLDLEGNSDIEADIMGSVETEDSSNVVTQMQSSGASEYIFPDVASRYLTRSEVEALSLQAICYAKNEVYAMHGRKFRSKELQEYFSSKSWYYGIIEPDDFSDRVFNDYERQNIQLLVSCEEAIRSDGYQLDQPGYDIHAVGTASKDDNSGMKTGAMTEEQYLQQNFIFEDSDVRILSETEIENLSFKVVSYAAYEIYARRGCIFESQELQTYFDQKDWYSGKILQADFSQDLFNSVEKSNLELLKKRRKELKGQ